MSRFTGPCLSAPKRAALSRQPAAVSRASGPANALGPAGLSSAPKHAGPPFATRRLGGREPAPPRCPSARGWARRRSRGCLRPPSAHLLAKSARIEAPALKEAPVLREAPCPAAPRWRLSGSSGQGRQAGSPGRIGKRCGLHGSARRYLPGGICPDIDLWGIGTQPRSRPDSPSTKAGCPMS